MSERVKFGSRSKSSNSTASYQSDRLQQLKRQYDERRQAVESDLMRESRYIREMEAKLQRLQNQRSSYQDHSNPEHRRLRSEFSQPLLRNSVPIEDTEADISKSPDLLQPKHATSFQPSRTAESREFESTFTEVSPCKGRGMSEDEVSTKSQSTHSFQPQAAQNPHRIDHDCVYLSTLTVADMCTLLHKHNLARYQEEFEQNGIDGQTLCDPTLSDADLLELGVDLRLHRRKLLSLLAEYKAWGVPRKLLQCVEPSEAKLHSSYHQTHQGCVSHAPLVPLPRPSLDSSLEKSAESLLSPSPCSPFKKSMESLQSPKTPSAEGARVHCSDSGLDSGLQNEGKDNHTVSQTHRYGVEGAERACDARRLDVEGERVIDSSGPFVEGKYRHGTVCETSKVDARSKYDMCMPCDISRAEAERGGSSGDKSCEGCDAEGGVVKGAYGATVPSREVLKEEGSVGGQEWGLSEDFEDEKGLRSHLEEAQFSTDEFESSPISPEALLSAVQQQ